jgi:ribosomal protein S18 acetylase RimI-like enzyme
MQHTIRLAAWKDFRALMKVQRQIALGTEHLAVTRKDRIDSILYAFAKAVLNRKRVYTFIATDEKNIIGYITMVTGKFLKGKGTAYIVMGVLASYRGRGIGTQLLAHTEEVARAQGIHRIELEVFENNENAVRLYEKLGFVAEGRRREAIRTPEGYEDVIWMGKLL